jgi:hypothetical protein
MFVVIPKLSIRVMFGEHHACSVCREVNESASCGQIRVQC